MRQNRTSNINKAAEAAVKKYKQKKATKKVFSFLALCVAMVTIINLIIPALALTSKENVHDISVDGHKHDDSCYIERPVLDEQGNPTGETEKVLACGKEESADSVNNNGQAVSPEKLICGMEEHRHTEECYTYVPVEEVKSAEANAENTEDAQAEPEMVKVLICGKEEHRHHTECYKTEQTTISSMEEDSAKNITAESAENIEGESTESIEEIHADNIEESLSENIAAESVSAIDDPAASEPTIFFMNNSEDEFSESEESEDLQETTESEDLQEPSESEESADSQESNSETPEDAEPSTEEYMNYPAQEFTGITASIAVSVVAPEGAFPTGTTMTVKEVADQETVDTIISSIESQPEARKVQTVQAVDITFTDIDGNEIEPLVPIRVALISSVIKEASENAEAEVLAVHVDNEGQTEMVELVNDETGKAENELVFEADSFSVYAAVQVKAAPIADSAFFKTAERVVIAYVDDEGKYNVLKSDGSFEKFESQEDLDFLDSQYLWRFYYVFTEKNQDAPNANYEYYFIRPTEDLSKSIALIDVNDASLIQAGANNAAVIPNGDGTYYMEGYSSVGDPMPYLSFDGTKFAADMTDPVPLTFYTQEDIKKYQFTVRTANPDMGLVYGKDKEGNAVNAVEQFVTRTKDSGNNNWGAEAKAIEETAGGQYRYLFDYFDLNGEVVPAEKVTITNGGRNAKIGANQLEIPYNGSILTAHFKQNPNYVGASRVDSLTEWVNTLKNTNVPLDEEATKKTAEVYDYENRIYRVDLTTRSSLSSFTGTVDLGLILDVSGSMKFPSKLVAARNTSGAVIGTKSIRTINNVTARDWRGNPTRYAWQDWGMSPSEQYYVIAEAHTKATVYRLFYSNNAWYRIDASNENSTASNNLIGANTAFGADNTDAATTYPIYASGDNYANGTPIERSYYEKQSIDNTADTLNQVLQILNIADSSSESPNVRAAWNTYAYSVMTSHPEFVSLQDHNTLDINYATMGGTRTDKALTDALGFNWGSSNTKYAILITDGAPQFGSQRTTSSGYDPDPYNTSSYSLEQQTRELVRRIKVIKEDYARRGIKLITVGLSMKDVEMGTQLLYDIADTVNGKRMFFEAESGDELENILLEIVKNFILPCNVYGDVTDTVGEAFYLVDRNTGKALQPGDHISLSGDLTDDLNGAYGTVQADGRTVKWESQEFTPEGWHGTVYVKAKEDLLGGNMLPTNTGDAVIEAKQYSTRSNPEHKINITDDTSQIVNPAKFHPVQYRETPLVNVNELSFLHEETEWTVYLGTEVDPKDQLKRIYENILVEEVIKKNKGQDTDGDGLPDQVLYENGDTDNNWYPISPDSITDDRESQASAASTRNTFYMKDLLVKLIKELISGGDTTRNDWNHFLTKDGQGRDILNWDYFLTEALKENGIVIPYHEYGITDGSNIKITLTKEIVEGEKSDLVNGSPHAAAVVSTVGTDGKYEPVETYTLTVLYSPDYTVLPRGQGGSNARDYHAGIYGTMYQGHAAGTETSRNTHKINVFTKGLSITKTDEGFENTLTGAIFNLYRTARETDAETETVDGLAGEYTLAATMDMSENATYVNDPLEQLNENEKYYLAEKVAPEGYTLLPAPIEIQLTINDEYAATYEEDENDSYTDIPAKNLFNWTQTAKISMEGTYVRRYDAEGNNLTGIGVEADSATDVSIFRVANNCGFELPATGGIGTSVIYMLGIFLMAFSGGGILMKKKFMIF